VSQKPPLPPDLIAEIDRLAPQLTMLDHYRVLGVTESASADELKAAYVRALARFHPGRWQARDTEKHQKRMEAIFARATEAYEELRDPPRRLDYDRALSKVRGIARSSAMPGAAQRDAAPVRTERRAPSATELASAARLMDQLRPQPKPMPTPAEPTAPTTPPRDAILVVEDDEALRRMLARILDEIGEVRAVADGAQALEALSVDPLPRLVVTDVMMPNVDGLELAQRIKADPRTKRIPIVMLTAKQAPRDVIEGVNAGARIYVTKPFKVDDLRAKVKKALGR
jgi:CheY-like chemotaxis protein